MRNKIIIGLLFCIVLLFAVNPPTYKAVKGVSRTQDIFNKYSPQNFTYEIDWTSSTFEVAADTFATNIVLPKSVLTDFYIVTTDSINGTAGTAIDSVVVKFWIGSTLTDATSYQATGADTLLATYTLPTSCVPLTVTSKQYISANSTLRIGFVNSNTYKTFAKGKMRLVGTYMLIE